MADMKIWVAIAVAAIALGIWGIRLWPRSTPSENALRDTQGLEAVVLRLSAANGGSSVTCRLTNHRSHTAAQVVFQVALQQTNGTILAVNPLASAAAIMPGETREISVFVPTTNRLSDVMARITVSLVHWQK